MEKKFLDIVIADDDQFIRIFLKDVFALHARDGMEYNVRTASNVEETRSEIFKKRPDILFLDLSMPNREGEHNETQAGFSVLKELRTNPFYKTLPICIFSGFSDQELKDKAKELGANDYLVKGEFLPKDIMSLTQRYSSLEKK